MEKEKILTTFLEGNEIILGYAESKKINECPYYVNIIGNSINADLSNRCSSIKCEPCSFVGDSFLQCKIYKVTKYLEE